MKLGNKAKLLSGIATSAVVLSVTAAPAWAAQSNMGTQVLPTPTTQNAAIQLRVNLDNLLGEHAVLAILAMEKIYSGSPDANAEVAALNQNTDQLTSAIQSVFGASAAAEFKTMWQGHINDFVAYVMAAKNSDPAGEQQALNALAQYREHFSSFMSSATGLPQTAVANNLQIHVNQLLTTFNDYKNKDYAASEQEFAAAYNHMFQVGDAISGGIVKEFPQKFGKVNPDTPAANLRVQLDELLGEHADLALLSMYAGYAGSADFSALAGQLSTDTNQLTSAIQSIYGDAAASQFKAMWQQHINDFVAYVQATTKQDGAGQQQALDNLAQYRAKFSAFMSSATGLPSSAIADNLQIHVQQLIASFTDFVNHDYQNQWSEYVTSYNHMFDVGGALASGIVSQVPQKFASSSDMWNWTAISVDVTGRSVSMPLGVWGINPETNKSEEYVPIWYVMKALSQEGVMSKWNGSAWWLTTPYQSNMNSSFNGSTDTIVIHGKTIGHVDALIAPDPYGRTQTTYMAASDVMKVLSDAGIQSSWSGSTLNIK
ncbi:hypothetical protein [Alicyclobacillus ferrooxydans]|uniref:Copper amine oxidase-like N-terminal domain-containing protein n=1 Tax=Alicyclobacillus ferrooxydans TaxID=471514 RepID=A0A0N8PN50_9BACL|nr:hypothetical protein [Alicyclobacillus ferrooxydans]KPV40541.1 hypothetical protein AN477_21935 [Alicyclobacillus ferrooxydans]